MRAGPARTERCGARQLFGSCSRTEQRLVRTDRWTGVDRDRPYRRVRHRGGAAERCTLAAALYLGPQGRRGVRSERRRNQQRRGPRWLRAQRDHASLKRVVRVRKGVSRVGRQR